MVIAMIMASGNGTRMGKTTVPKQFMSIDNKPVLMYSVSKFNENENVDKILIVTNKEHISEVKNWCVQFKINKLFDVVSGGETRQQSVFNGLTFLKNSNVKNDDFILIHDGARPLINEQIINDNIDGLKQFDAVDTVMKSADTVMKSSNGDVLENIIDRNEIYLSQTPQSFKFGLIFSAHEEARKNNDIDATDDCKLALKSNTKIHFVQGSKMNFKITTQEDLQLFKSLINNKFK